MPPPPAASSVGRSPSLLVAAVLVLSACAAAPTHPSSGSSPPVVPVASATTPIRSDKPTSGTTATPTVDGQIVFEDAGRDFQFSQIWIENADGSNVRQLVSDDFTDGGPSLSRDGRHLLFYQGYPGSLEEVLADPNLFGRIMLVNVDGSGLHELQTGNRANRCDASAEGDAWSPDGRRVVFTRTCFDTSGELRRVGHLDHQCRRDRRSRGDEVGPCEVPRSGDLGVASRRPSRQLVTRWQAARLRADRHVDEARARGDLHNRDQRQGPRPGHAMGARRERPGLVARWQPDRIQLTGRTEP